MKKLYRITIITPSNNIDRGVWAESVIFSDAHIKFFNMGFDGNELVAAYPSNSTMITNIETKDEYDQRKNS